MEENYTSEFYDQMQDRNTRTAMEIMPYIIEKLNPSSIVDIGCGRGIFLSVAKKIDKNVSVLGIDGDYVEREKLLIDQDEFIAFDLKKELNLQKKFDVAISFEVAEHIEEEYSERFIQNIVKLSDVIVFSAAIPLQGGTNHVNEQYPSYWKKIFADCGYYCSDIIRRVFWNNGTIEPHRKQNLMLYVKDNLFDEVINKFNNIDNESYLDVIHPQFFGKMQKYWMEMYIEQKKKFETEKNMLQAIVCQNLEIMGNIISDMSLFDMVDEFEVIVYCLHIIKSNNVLLFDGIRSQYGQNEYVIWGAGHDGQKILELLNLFEINSRLLFSSDVNREQSINDFILQYHGEVLIIGTRKYKKEILDEIAKDDRFIDVNLYKEQKNIS